MNSCRHPKTLRLIREVAVAAWFVLVVHAVAQPSRLVNLSARGVVTSDTDPLIAGFVVAGDTGKTLLLRGVGPTLESFGVTGALADPTLSIFSTTGLFA